MAQNENYSVVDLRIGTEAQFNAKVDTLPAGTLFGVTDATVSKADLSTDLKNEINGKINKPASPTTESAITINSSGTISTKPLTSITGKSEVYVGSTTPTNEDEILWINPDGTSGGGGSSGGNVYIHSIRLNAQFTYNDNASGDFLFSFTSSRQTEYKLQDLTTLFNAFGSNIITTATILKQETGSLPHHGIANVLYSEGADVLEIRAFIEDSNTVTGYYKSGSLGNITSLQDTVTGI